MIKFTLIGRTKGLCKSGRISILFCFAVCFRISFSITIWTTLIMSSNTRSTCLRLKRRIWRLWGLTLRTRLSLWFFSCWKDLRLETWKTRRIWRKRLTNSKRLKFLLIREKRRSKWFRSKMSRFRKKWVPKSTLSKMDKVMPMITISLSLKEWMFLLTRRHFSSLIMKRRLNQFRGNDNKLKVNLCW